MAKGIIRSRIGRKLTLAIILFSSFITLILTSVQLYMEYRFNLREIEDNMTYVGTGYLTSLSHSVWVYDDRQVLAQLEGIVGLPGTEYAEISNNSKIEWTYGSFSSKYTVENDFPLTVVEDQIKYDLGTLRVVNSLDRIYRKLFNRAVTILVSNGIKTFLVAGFILLLFHHLVTRRLVEVAGKLYSSKLPLDEYQTKKIKKSSRENRHDEMEEVIASIHIYQETINENYEKLQVEETKYRELISRMSAGFALHEIILNDEGDPVDYRFITVNDTFEEITGLKGSDVVGRTVLEILPHTESYWIETFGKVALTGEATSYENYSKELGKYFQVKAYSPKNRQFATIIFDISDRILAKAELEKKSELLVEMEKIGKIGGWAFDPETLDGTWTNGTATIHDLDPEEETNVEIGLDLYQGESRQRIENAVQKAIADGTPYNLELEITTCKGNRKWLRTIGKPIKEGAKVVAVKGVLQDITEFKKIELELAQYRDNLEDLVRERTGELNRRISESELLNKAMINLLDDLQTSNQKFEMVSKKVTEANRELEGFAYSVSHDLRAPLRHMSGFVDMLLRHAEGSLDEKSNRCVRIIKESSEKMGQLIDDLLHYSRTGRADLNSTKINNNLLVKDVITELTTYNPNREINWHVEPMPNVYADYSLMRIVWVNLLSNAVKFTRDTVNTEISIGAKHNDDEEVQFFVEDNGSGFDMKYKDKLFGVFQRLHGEKEFEGTGIGLATVQRILHRHDGRVWAQGYVGRGATFYFTLPQKQ